MGQCRTKELFPTLQSPTFNRDKKKNILREGIHIHITVVHVTGIHNMYADIFILREKKIVIACYINAQARIKFLSLLNSYETKSVV